MKTSPALTLTVVGTGPSGIAKLDGLQLAGSGGQPGTNYVASVTAKAVKPIAAVVGNTIVIRTERAIRRARPRGAKRGANPRCCQSAPGIVPGSSRRPQAGFPSQPLRGLPHPAIDAERLSAVDHAT